MKHVIALCLLLVPSVSEASVLGFLFGTDHPQVTIARMEMRNQRVMQSRQMKHDRVAMKMGYAPPSYSRVAVSYRSAPPKLVSVRRGSVIFYYVR